MSLLSYSTPQPPHKLRKNQQQQQKGGGGGGGGSSRFLITVNVIGSSGPLRFLVKQDELVATVIQTALRFYAREGRRPALGSDINGFLLYCANSGSDALSPWETIGAHGIRNFVMCKKQAAGDAPDSRVLNRKRSRNWKSWLSFSISSH